MKKYRKLATEIAKDTIKLHRNVSKTQAVFTIPQKA